jgi:hypothetical protein
MPRIAKTRGARSRRGIASVVALVAVGCTLLRGLVFAAPARWFDLELERPDGAESHDTRDDEVRCRLCRPGSDIAMVPLSCQETLRAAEALAGWNRSAIYEIDALLQSGALGRPDTRRARDRAHLLARLRLRNWYSFLFPYARDPERVYSAGPADLAAVTSLFRESSIFPVAQLTEARMGLGGVCVRYDLAQEKVGWTVMGGKRYRYRVEDVEIDDEVRRVLKFEWRTSAGEAVEIFLSDHYSFKVAYGRSSDHARSSELFLVYAVTGVWVRRHGIHRPYAVAFWTMQPGPAAPEHPSVARAGAAIYFPKLTFKLPLFLPRIHLDDWRKLGLPTPFVPADAVQRGDLPDWLPTDAAADLVGWEGLGPIPRRLRTLFPDR